MVPCTLSRITISFSRIYARLPNTFRRVVHASSKLTMIRPAVPAQYYWNNSREVCFRMTASANCRPLLRGGIRFYNMEGENTGRYIEMRGECLRNRLRSRSRCGGMFAKRAAEYIGRIGHSGISLLRSAGSV